MCLQSTRLPLFQAAAATLLALPVALFAAEPPATPGPSATPRAIPAFPGAEGYGAATRGGRAGKVLLVTTLNDAGPGSLRAAIDTPGPRTVVFRVSGTIRLDSPLTVKHPFLTVAGQSAPGDGICIARHPFNIDADDVVLRYLRIRVGDESGNDVDAVSSRYRKNLILDHLSTSWSIDETLSIYHCEHVTVQWCLIAESLYGSNHVKGTHGYGGIWGSNYSSYHHNLLAHHTSRNPRFASGSGFTDFRNNVIYNWGFNSAYGGEKRQGDTKYNFTTVNMVANYYKPGPATNKGHVSHRILNPSARAPDDFGQWFIADNVVEGNLQVSADNWNGGVQFEGTAGTLAELRLDKPWPSLPIRQESAQQAFASVLESAGAYVPRRDSLDARVVDETRGGFATFEGATHRKNNRSPDPSKKSGIIDSQKDVGGWPELKSAPAPRDDDADGMSDDWERQHGLNPQNAADAALDKDADGYTNVEEALNGTDPTVFIDYTKPENNVNTLKSAN